MFSNPLARLVMGAVVATPTVFMIMTFMRLLVLGEDFQLADKEDRVEIVLQSDKTDSEVRRRDNAPEAPPEAQTPPPPPELNVTKAEKPSEDMSSYLGKLPDLEAGDVGGQDVEFVVADSDEQPIFRPVQYPQRAQERDLDGSCTVTVDVSPDGSVVNPRAECTSSLFVRQVQRDALKWKYRPRVQDGEQVFRYNRVVVVEYKMPD